MLKSGAIVGAIALGAFNITKILMVILIQATNMLTVPLFHPVKFLSVNLFQQ
jgi:hypothetical protein